MIVAALVEIPPLVRGNLQLSKNLFALMPVLTGFHRPQFKWCVFFVNVNW